MRQSLFCVIGDGQLARYLCQSAKKQGMETCVIGRVNSSAAKYADQIIATPKEIDANDRDVVVTFENEFLDIDKVTEELQEKGLECRPDLSAIAVLREKRKQKQCLEKLKIPSSEYIEWKSGSVDKFLLNVGKQFPKDAVIKWSTGGYDSKGVFFFGPGASLLDAAAFCERAKANGHEVFAEEKVAFEKELAIVASRDKNGFFRFLPLVETWQERGICRLARSFEASKQQNEEARAICEAIMSEWDYVGVLAVELFETRKGKLFVNEIAPRVHNSGHFSLLASQNSQFDMHVAAVTGGSLESNKNTSFFAMWNILGPSDTDGFELLEAPDDNLPIADGIKLFWYDKSIVKARRKMGHLCAVADSAEELEDRIYAMKLWEEKFWEKHQIV